MKKNSIFALVFLFSTINVFNMQAQTTEQLHDFAEFLKETAPRDSTQKVSAVASDASNVYYVVISDEGQSGIANLYSQNNNGEIQRLGSDEDVDNLILESTPHSQAEELIFQLAESEVKMEGKEKLEAGMQNLVNMFGPNALNYLSIERIKAYHKLGIVTPNQRSGAE